MDDIRKNLQLFVRRFGLLNASCCDECCGEQVSLVQSHILFEVRRMGKQSIQQLADELGMDITTLSRQVKTLEGKNLIIKTISPEDRRVSLLALTAEGERVMNQIDRYMAAKIEQIFAFMTPFERDSIVRSLDLLNEALGKTGSCCTSSAPATKVACCK